MKNYDDYYLGIDLGTSSIGWAVTDEKYNILRFNKKYMWGTHLYDMGETAAERRNFRTSRRRLKRKKERIEMLQLLFSKEISKKDLGFFLRLKESQYHLEDKSVGNKNTLFMDENYTDINYHNDYPTIYHLRKALIDNESQAFEVRKLYLAISHILSHRGHFLFEGKMNGNDIQNFEEIFQQFTRECKESYGIEFDLKDENSLGKVKEILTEKNLSRTKKKEELSKLLIEEKDKINQEIWKLIVGNEAKMAIIFDSKEYEEAKISFSKGNYDDKESEYEIILGEKIEFLRFAKAIYDWMLLQNILKEDKYLSYSKVKSYEEHHKDLKMLKDLLKKEDKKVFKEVFGEKGLYENYVKKNQKEEFYKRISEILKTKEEETQVFEILKKIETDSFLLKQKIEDNGVIPRQIHQKELEKILENAEKYFLWLSEKDETGLSISKKIIKLFEFKIPYYVGPLYDKSPFAWVIRKEYNKITPWNFEKEVDMGATAEAFIRKMTNKCTYLREKDVIPKNSLLYTKYMVLNELNNLKIRGNKIEVELKQKIYNELFQNNKKIGMKTLLNFLKSENIQVEKSEITGIDGTFNTSLSSYVDMKKIFENDILKDSYKLMIEDIILWITLYGEEKKLIKSKILDKYKDLITDDQLKQVLKLKYKDWSRLSKEFLTEIEAPDLETGELMSIIRRMWETNDNLMELLSYKYGYLKEIEEYNGVREFSGDLRYENLVKDLQVSPSVKKMIWKALVITKEIKKVTKKAPKKVFIEMARDAETEKKRTEKRKDKLLNLYKAIKDDDSIKELENNLKNVTDEQLKSKKLYLYYLQLGRCMYSGERIELSDLMNDNLYDIDHIYPQSRVKDDSFDNTVLVKKELNADKRDEPLKSNIQDKMKSFWLILKSKELISNKKYERLTRTIYKFTDDELAGFINRQLVETRQATKVVADLIKLIFGDETKVVYVKAGLTSDFRQKFGIYKFRELNDYHHAHDGYLNIIVGNIYNTKFTDNPYNFIKERKNNDKEKNNGRFYNLRRIFDFNSEVWNKEEMIPKIERYIYKIRPLFTRASYTRKGKFYDIQYVQKNKNLIPKKNNLDPNKYGGYTGVENSCFIFYKYQKGKKEMKKIDTIPVYLKNKIYLEEDVIKYLQEKKGIESNSIELLLNNIKINSHVLVDGEIYYLRGKPDENRLGVGYEKQLILSKDNFEFLRRLIKNIEILKKDKENLEHKLPNILKLNNNKKLTFEEINLKLSSIYNELYYKIDKGNFSKIFNMITIPLKEYIDKSNFGDFDKLDMYSKIRTIEEIFKTITKLNNFNLKDIGGHSAITNARISISRILNSKDFCIINQSPAGLFENKVYLDK